MNIFVGGIAPIPTQIMKDPAKPVAPRLGEITFGEIAKIGEVRHSSMTVSYASTPRSVSYSRRKSYAYG